MGPAAVSVSPTRLGVCCAAVLRLVAPRRFGGLYFLLPRYKQFRFTSNDASSFTFTEAKKHFNFFKRDKIVVNHNKKCMSSIFPEDATSTYSLRPQM